ncbi:hypothetical protein [Amycolatopsis cihanbeyliensis]|uniref:Uncharacterized protein n=1 Tax=Amycolatopsis cihanbeyliensis TaxID=1128664 RepID=A0A542DP49_AMYCI|nr:hypothetical protein [Amycolatopsis cihanbeyliensis]TQJ04870.1 hypothetical protein FB471_4680 [Amycolatopsis cihanbeyliensis]
MESRMYGKDTTELEAVPTTVPIPVPTTAPDRQEEVTEPLAAPGRTSGRWWRGLTGSLAAGLAVLAVGVLGAQVLGWASASSGPGAFMTCGHLLAAGLAILAQRVVDRGTGRLAGLAALAVVLLVVAPLWLFWWH